MLMPDNKSAAAPASDPPISTLNIPKISNNPALIHGPLRSDKSITTWPSTR